jgi:hypothetical protein
VESAVTRRCPLQVVGLDNGDGLSSAHRGAAAKGWNGKGAAALRALSASVLEDPPEGANAEPLLGIKHQATGSPRQVLTSFGVVTASWEEP